jgi:hypothetical protein
MKKILQIICALLALSSQQALAQQTILNVPSSSILEKDQNFFEHESQFKTSDPDQFLNLTNYYARGIGHDTEIDVTQFNIGTPASKNASLGIGTKTSFALDKNSPYEPSVILGVMAPFSLQGEGVGHWIYSTLNVYLPQTKTRLTAGFSSGSKQIFGEDVKSFIGGIEQEISEKLGLYVDWYSGNHALGVGAFALGYSFSDNFVIYGGYQVANYNQNSLNSYILEVATYF